MKNQFVTYKIALKLKELGFNEDCICGYTESKYLVSKVATTNYSDCYSHHDKYDTDIKAPLWQQVIDWFRDTQNIFIEITDRAGFLNSKAFIYRISILHTNIVLFTSGTAMGRIYPEKQIEFKTYYKSREAAILKAISIHPYYKIKDL